MKCTIIFEDNEAGVLLSTNVEPPITPELAKNPTVAMHCFARVMQFLQEAGVFGQTSTEEPK
jgi:hypothetical protein